MSFSIGSSGAGMGPRTAIEQFGAPETDRKTDSGPVVRRMLGFLRPHRGRMALAFVFMLIESGLTLLAPYLLKVAVDGYITAGNARGLNGVVAALALSFIGLFGAAASQSYLLSWVGQRVLARLRLLLFRHLQRLSKSYHDTHIVGVTVSRLINDVAEINELFSQGLITLIGDLLVLAGILVVMFSMSPRLALLTFTVLPLMVLATAWFSRHARSAFRDTRNRVAAVVGDLAENLAAMRVIQAFAQERQARRRFDHLNAANRNAYIRAMSLSFVFLPAIEFLGSLSMLIVLLFGGLAVARGEVTLGVLVAFLTYVTRFFGPVQELSRLFTTWQSAMAAGAEVFHLLDTEPEVADAPDAVHLPPLEGRIEFAAVSFRYREDAPLVLEDINLQIEPGETVALVGPTGAGKTTIAALAARFYDVSAGAVRLDGYDVRAVTQASLHRQVAIVAQDPFLFSRSIADNIRFGRPEAGLDAVIEAARLANAHDFISALPAGYDTHIQEGGVNLSVGQRQLISIARAILSWPRILILDEATASIDTISEALIQEAVGRLLHGRTALVIAHRLNTVRSAGRIVVVDGGRIVEQGTHAALLERGGLYATLHARQFAME